MLILTRKPGESIFIGEDIKITIVEIRGHQIRVGIEAPKDMRIYREEIFKQIRSENTQAAESTKQTEKLIDTISEQIKSKEVEESDLNSEEEKKENDK